MSDYVGKPLPREVIVYDMKMLRVDADEDEILWMEEHQIQDIALATTKGGKHYDEGARYDWPPTQTRREVEWPVYAADEDRQTGLRLETILRGRRP